jgi:hypothetical protein
MLPLNDTEENRYSFFPVVTVMFILLNCSIYFLELRSVDDYWIHYMKYGLTPALIRAQEGGGVISNVTAMFMH